MKQLDSIAKLINKFQKLPGVGYKTAQRYAYSVIDMSLDDVDDFIFALSDVKQSVCYCDVCGNFADSKTCKICLNRNSNTVLVVAYPKDVLALEKLGTANNYHVLHGTLSPLEGRGPNEIRIKELLARLNNGNISEVILATNPDVEGDATAMYIAKLIKPLGVKVSRIAQGISMGSDIEYADEVTLARAIEARTII